MQRWSPVTDYRSLGREGAVELGKYRIIAQVGSGGGATVYLALTSGAAGASKLLVVKVLKTDLGDNPDVLPMFLDEARLSMRLNHPNIVQVIDVGEARDRHFLVMEYLEGKPFKRILESRIPGLGENVLLQLIVEALEGLHYAHELCDDDGAPLGVVHRDFSPQNLFVSYEGHTKLLDFGVAKVQLTSTATETGIIKGKPRYMAPEQARGEAVDRRTDVFSVGVVLWETIAGRRMWAGKHDVPVLFAVSRGEIPSLVEAAPHAAPALVKIVRRALAPAAQDRYPTALALQEDLEEYLRTAGGLLRPREIGQILRRHYAADREQIAAAVARQRKALATAAAEFRVVSIPDIETGALGMSEGSDSRQRDTRSEPPGSASATIAPPRPEGRGGKMPLAIAALAVAMLIAVATVPSTTLEALRSTVAGPPARPAAEATAPPPPALVPATAPPPQAAPSDAPRAAVLPAAADSVHADTSSAHHAPPPRWSPPAPHTAAATEPAAEIAATPAPAPTAHSAPSQSATPARKKHAVDSTNPYDE